MITISLGRMGDIINVLPYLHQETRETGAKAQLMVSQEYASILEGTSYIQPTIYPGAWDDLGGAVRYAEKLGWPANEIRVAQVCGPKEIVKQEAYNKFQMNGKQAESFSKEAIRLLGRLDEWRNQYPLVFNSRNKAREQSIVEQYNPLTRWILVATGGFSSPFPHKELLWSVLAQSYAQNHLIIDISTIVAERFYDLLGLMEHPSVKCMVLTDSAPLHLAYAVNKPVCALIADKPTLWHGTAYRPQQHISYIRYSEFPERTDELVSAINNIGKPGSAF